MRVDPRKSSMIRDASKRWFACFAVQLLSRICRLRRHACVANHPACPSKVLPKAGRQGDGQDRQGEGARRRAGRSFRSGPLEPDFRAVDIRSVSTSLRQTPPYQKHNHQSHGDT